MDFFNGSPSTGGLGAVSHGSSSSSPQFNLASLKDDWKSYVPAVLLTGLAIVILNSVAVLVHNLFFHPLAKYPGPFWARASVFWRIWHTSVGRYHRVIDRVHEQYGPVVRIAPNELSFGTASSWKQIYGHPAPGNQTLVKSEFYEIYGSGYESLCIGSERDPKKHSTMKKNLVNAFSTKALLEQEDIIDEVVDRFIDKIGAIGGPGTPGLNMTKWYEMVSFDILGEMAFGKSFGSIEAEKPHFWSDMIVEHLFFITVADNIQRLPAIAAFLKLFLPLTEGIKKKHGAYSRQAVEKRLNEDSDRKDFLSKLVDQVHSGNVSREEMTAHTSTLVIAGGETVSTFLAAVTYYLLKNPPVYTKMKEEIRQAFSSYDSINANAALQLPYLQAIISEGLRMYPPGSQGFPRVSPGQDVDGHYVPKGAIVSTPGWTVTHDEKNFHEPMSFKPERWTDPDCKDNKEASQPFSLGPRGCIGRNFAYVEMSLILSKIHWTYDLELVNTDLDWEGESTIHVMWGKPSVYTRFIKRQ